MDKENHGYLLKVQNLNVVFHSKKTNVHALQNSSFELKSKQSLGIVGESGSGKSVTSLALLDLYRESPLVHSSGTVDVNIENKMVRLTELSNTALQKVRGVKIGLVLQEPGSTLNPVIKCGKQLEEFLRIHNIRDGVSSKEMVLQSFRQVSLDDVERIYNSYPHEISGGQLQRVCIAMAIIAKPQLLICDEATSALDLTTQKEILNLLGKLRNELGLALICISHDLNVVAEICDRVIIMKDGLIVEEGETTNIFSKPKHHYTQELLNNRPSLTKKLSTESKSKGDFKTLTINSLTHQYSVRTSGFLNRKQYDTVLEKVTFSLYKSEILGIVGESGSGKSTIAKAIVGIIKPTSGEIKFISEESKPLKPTERSKRAIQLIFQDPYSSLNPSMSIGRSLYELIDHYKLTSKLKIKDRVSLLLEQVGLSKDLYNRLPNELSGGQRQRVCIAKALSLEPEILICDECVSALDVTIQAQILRLLLKLRRELGLSIIFISHDLAVINMICDRVIVMQDGRIAEEGTPNEIIHNPQSLHTQKLLSSILKRGGFSSK